MRGSFIEDKEAWVFLLPDENGQERECKVLVAFEYEESGRKFMLYTDNVVGEDGHVRTYANEFTGDEEDFQLFPIPAEDTCIWSLMDELRAKSLAGYDAEDLAMMLLEADAKNTVDELCELLPQRKRVLQAIMDNPDELDPADVLDRLLRELFEVLEEHTNSE